MYSRLSRGLHCACNMQLRAAHGVSNPVMSKVARLFASPLITQSVALSASNCIIKLQP